jgi:hypothetical protein
VTKDLIGEIIYSNCLKTSSFFQGAEYEIFDIIYNPNHYCILPNNNLIIADTNKIGFYDENFRLLKSVNHFEGLYIRINGLTNSHSNLYISDSVHNQIIITDFDLNHKKSFGSLGNGDDQFNKPEGLCWSKSGCLYVCDCGNKRVQVLDEDLKLMKSIVLDFYPTKIQVSNTTVCLTGYTDDYDELMEIHNLSNWKLKSKYKNVNSLNQIKSFFYSIEHFSTISCFNSDGNLINRLDLRKIIDHITPEFLISGMFLFNGNLILCSDDKRCIKFGVKYQESDF